MSQVVSNSFMWQRIAQRYAELFKNKGQLTADLWWQSFKFTLTEEDLLKTKAHIKELLAPLKKA